MMFDLIVLLNLVIAILAGTYSELAQYSLGLYYDSLVTEIQLKQTHKYYGALASTYQIMSPIGWILVPFMACFKKQSASLAKFNRLANLALYLPISLVLLGIFMVCNLVSLPFSYFAAILTKYRLIVKFWHSERDKATLVADLLIYVSIGLVYMILAQFKDAFYFYKHLFCTRINAKIGGVPYIDLKTFELLVEIFDSYGGVNCKT
jgi:hypothetical protein